MPTHFNFSSHGLVLTVLSNQRDVPVPKFTLAFLREYGQDWRDKDEHCSWNDLPQDASGAHEATFQTCQWQPTLKLHKAYFLLLSFPSFCIFPFFWKKTQAKLAVIQAQLSVNRAKLPAPLFFERWGEFGQNGFRRNFWPRAELPASGRTFSLNWFGLKLQPAEGLGIWHDWIYLGSCTPQTPIGSPTANTFWTAPSFGSDDMFTNFFSDRLIWTFDYLFKPRNNFSAYRNANSISLCAHASPSLISYYLNILCVLAPPNTCKPRGVALVKTFLGNQFIYDLILR